jgi:hypothetical protein
MTKPPTAPEAVGSSSARRELAPPGAGIPFPQRIFLRWILNPFVAGREDPALSDRRFERLHEKIEKTYLEIPEALRGKKVLVPPQRGLEDSSRYWSAAMVLEHLEIVERGVAGIIVELSHKRSPTQTVSTALVKPVSGMTPGEALLRFRVLRADFLPNLHAKIGDLNARGTHRHPWFGPFTARKWNWLLGIHAGIHLRQLRAIRNGLPGAVAKA